MRHAGVDGCRGGWLAATLDGTIALHRSFRDLIEAVEGVVAVDVPIGLLDEGRTGDRACDKAARKILGPRRGSVFPPPLRKRLFGMERPPELGVQSWNILPRIREVDALMTPHLQARVVEAHPELAFAALAGAPLACPKKSREGRRERRVLLEGVMPVPERPPRGAAHDDLLDACVLAWTARRVALGRGLRVPEGEPPRDSAGLRMEIHA